MHRGPGGGPTYQGAVPGPPTSSLLPARARQHLRLVKSSDTSASQDSSPGPLVSGMEGQGGVVGGWLVILGTLGLEVVLLPDGNSVTFQYDLDTGMRCLLCRSSLVNVEIQHVGTVGLEPVLYEMELVSPLLHRCFLATAQWREKTSHSTTSGKPSPRHYRQP